ncbi:ATP-binding protein [Xylophilus sp.]|uniref:ATP-binding protein n=1 Tax=Xylophilus sp. TaxID=2653893 RepID=UPI0013BD4037|nr:ATP-binding protein [Xylophilus sp.]KAF1047807.1 MAG: Sensor histidine kinase RegB [Xylophilus sp.]
MQTEAPAARDGAPAMPPRLDGGIAQADQATDFKNMQQLVVLRWLAVAGQIVTIAVVYLVFRIDLPLAPMAAVVAGLAAVNLAMWQHLRRRDTVHHGELLVALLVDMAGLTAQLYFSGGVNNPFIYLYLVQTMLGAVLLTGPAVWALFAITCASFIALTRTYIPLPLELHLEKGPGSLYLQGVLLCFVINAALLVSFVTRISRNLRERDAFLADLRQRAAEEEHIVRMGLLASGAAHELGTPLATLSVILGDWRRMEPFTGSAELLQEIGEMQIQLERCKNIVGGILLSAGEARGEAPVQTTLADFLDDLVAQWEQTRRPADLRYRRSFGEDWPIVSDSALQQMVCNVLDNALDASRSRVELSVLRDGSDLVLMVTDDGPGFAPQMLANLGKPYQSTKGCPGGGLGLFLSVNVARTLGGSLAASNRIGGGALVTVRLPLAAISLDDEDTAEDDDPQGGGTP